MSKKYRRDKVKRQHHVVPGLEEGLAVLSSLDAVDGVIPGIIRPKSGGTRGYTFQYLTQSGFKLIGRASGAAQEIFVITQKPGLVLTALYEAHIIPSSPDLPESPQDQN